ncbi:putative RNA-directed DNA polymerase from transposon BS, partial [Varanus komodoensis]
GCVVNLQGDRREHLLSQPAQQARIKKAAERSDLEEPSAPPRGAACAVFVFLPAGAMASMCNWCKLVALLEEKFLEEEWTGKEKYSKRMPSYKGSEGRNKAILDLRLTNREDLVDKEAAAGTRQNGLHGTTLRRIHIWRQSQAQWHLLKLRRGQLKPKLAPVESAWDLPQCRSAGHGGGCQAPPRPPTALRLNAGSAVGRSGFRPGYGTESALVALYDDLCRERDRGSASLLVLLDLSAAFDTIDHGILQDRLAGLGVGGTALQRFRSHLNGRFQKVVLGDYGSAPWQLCHGVSQGSILSPLLFNVYMKPLGEVIRRCGLRNHQYADDTQLYFSFSTNPGEAVAVLNRCLAEVMGWMRANKLKLNPDEREVLLVGGSGFGEGELNLVLNGVALPLRDKVRSLGVLLDPELSLEAQVTAVARSAFFQLWLIHQLCPYLEYDCLVTVTHALVTSHLYFCNALYVGLPLKTVRILQLVQNRAARLLTGTGRYVHMTPVLRQLHWLPIEVRAQFKVLASPLESRVEDLFDFKFFFSIDYDGQGYLLAAVARVGRVALRHLQATCETENLVSENVKVIDVLLTAESSHPLVLLHLPECVDKGRSCAYHAERWRSCSRDTKNPAIVQCQLKASYLEPGALKQ